jgi:hypothetical protein
MSGEPFKIAKVKKRVDGWKKFRTAQSDSPRQLEWASNIVEYVGHIRKATNIRAGTKKGTPPPPLSKEVPILGPRSNLCTSSTLSTIPSLLGAPNVSPKTCRGKAGLQQATVKFMV